MMKDFNKLLDGFITIEKVLYPPIKHIIVESDGLEHIIPKSLTAKEERIMRTWNFFHVNEKFAFKELMFWQNTKTKIPIIDFLKSLKKLDDKGYINYVEVDNIIQVVQS